MHLKLLSFNCVLIILWKVSVIFLQVSFGSLIGFLPYRNLAAKWKFLAFESWLRRRGLDPSKYKQSLGVIGSFETAGTVPTTESMLDPDFDKFDGEISPDMKLEDLLRIYDQEKLKFLSSFVGQVWSCSLLLQSLFRKLTNHLQS